MIHKKPMRKRRILKEAKGHSKICYVLSSLYFVTKFFKQTIFSLFDIFDFCFVKTINSYMFIIYKVLFHQLIQEYNQ